MASRQEVDAKVKCFEMGENWTKRTRTGGAKGNGGGENSRRRVVSKKIRNFEKG